MPLSAGDKLGPYEILAPIGAGGMGEVYQARDTRPNRNLAFKISKDQFTDRFEREARVSAGGETVSFDASMTEAALGYGSSRRGATCASRGASQA
jgi:serine/threonine protein kinase